MRSGWAGLHSRTVHLEPPTATREPATHPCWREPCVAITRLPAHAGPRPARRVAAQRPLAAGADLRSASHPAARAPHWLSPARRSAARPGAVQRAKAARHPQPPLPAAGRRAAGGQAGPRQGRPVDPDRTGHHRPGGSAVRRLDRRHPGLPPPARLHPDGGHHEFTLVYLGRIWPRVRDQLREREVDLKVVHVRTRQFWEQLDSNEVDLLCGGLAAPAGQADIAPGYDVIQWHCDTLTLLTNLDHRSLPNRRISSERLRILPRVISAAGIIVDFLHRWYGPGYRNQLTVAAEIDDIYYGLGLLRSHLVDGCMIVTRSIGQRALSGGLPGGSGFRIVELDDDFHPRLELVSGVFARKGERQQYASSHPLNILWDAF